MKIHEFEHGLKDRVAIVTGAAFGNGSAFCERLAEEGAIVVIADLADASDALVLSSGVGDGRALFSLQKTLHLDSSRIVPVNCMTIYVGTSADIYNSTFTALKVSSIDDQS